MSTPYGVGNALGHAASNPLHSDIGTAMLDSCTEVKTHLLQHDRSKKCST
jgi:hypothetical protein